jgi:hypothetical protein
MKIGCGAAVGRVIWLFCILEQDSWFQPRPMPLPTQLSFDFCLRGTKAV